MVWESKRFFRCFIFSFVSISIIMKASDEQQKVILLWSLVFAARASASYWQCVSLNRTWVDVPSLKPCCCFFFSLFIFSLKSHRVLFFFVFMCANRSKNNFHRLLCHMRIRWPLVFAVYTIIILKKFVPFLSWYFQLFSIRSKSSSNFIRVWMCVAIKTISSHIDREKSEH